MKSGWLERRRRELGARLAARGEAAALSLSTWAVFTVVRARLERYASGRCLDAGTGRSPFASELARLGLQVTRLDLEARAGGPPPDLLADLQAMPQVPAASFDTVLCTQVLEHLPRPWQALAELRRVLVPGGHLILSAPHLSWVHEAPHDYYRYTAFGLESLARGAGLEVLEVGPAGGLLAFLAHPLSAALLSVLGDQPALVRLHRALLVDALGPIDRGLGLAGRFPCNLILVARKPGRPQPGG